MAELAAMHSKNLFKKISCKPVVLRVSVSGSVASSLGLQPHLLHEVSLYAKNIQMSHGSTF